MRSEPGIGEALSRVAESFSRLLVQHLQLLRAELEAEGRQLAETGRVVGAATVRALPFLIGGIAIATLGIAQLLGLALEPWLGRAAGPLCTLICGVTEAALAGEWLRRGWSKGEGLRIGAKSAKRAVSDGSTELSLGVKRQNTNPACVPVVFEEKPYGSMG